MSKLKNERAEIKTLGASKKIQKRYAPSVRRWNEKMVSFHQKKESFIGPQIPVIQF